MIRLEKSAVPNNSKFMSGKALSKNELSKTIFKNRLSNKIKLRRNEMKIDKECIVFFLSFKVDALMHHNGLYNFVRSIIEGAFKKDRNKIRISPRCGARNA